MHLGLAKGDEDGSVESGLVMIPVTILFLTLIQIVVAGSFQILDKAQLHSMVIKSEVSGSETGDAISASKQVIPGLGTLSLVKSERAIPTFLLERFGILIGDKDGGQIWIRNFAIGFD